MIVNGWNFVLDKMISYFNKCRNVSHLEYSKIIRRDFSTPVVGKKISADMRQLTSIESVGSVEQHRLYINSQITHDVFRILVLLCCQ